MRDRIRAAGVTLVGDRHAVVALSGGADSAVAAWAVRETAVRAVHVHHGNAASDQLAAAAHAIADALGIRLTVRRVEPAGASETAGREARWKALRAECGPDEVVVTGHTRDDQAETVLLNLIRGSGPMGLAGMRNTDAIVRPLLGEAREDVRALAIELRLPFTDDPENESMGHARNRVRHTLIPELEADFNPAIQDALARTAAHAAELMPAPTHIRVGSGVARVAVGALRSASPAVRSATLREAMRAARPPDWPTAAELDRASAVAAGETARAELEGGIVVVRDRTSLRIGPLPASPVERRLGDGGTWGGFRFSVRASTGIPQLGPARARLRADVAWLIRAATKGDRIAMRGGHKDVWDLLAEVGVPSVLRSSWPVVTDHDAVVWVPLLRRAEWPPSPDAGYLDVDAHEEIW